MLKYQCICIYSELSTVILAYDSDVVCGLGPTLWLKWKMCEVIGFFKDLWRHFHELGDQYASWRKLLYEVIILVLTNCEYCKNKLVIKCTGNDVD